MPVIEEPGSQRAREPGNPPNSKVRDVYPLHFTASLTFTHFVTLVRVFARIAITACITCRDWKTDILLDGAHTDGERDNITVYINVLVVFVIKPEFVMRFHFYRSCTTLEVAIHNLLGLDYLNLVQLQFMKSCCLYVNITSYLL